MKDIEKLKTEHKEMKERLHKLIDFMNSKEYYSLDSSEKSLLGTQRAFLAIRLTTVLLMIWQR